MPVWQSPELEATLSGPLDERGLTEAALARLVRDAVEEGDQLEFKQFGAYEKRSGPRADWTEAHEFSKDVLALANHRGGLLLIGIKEEDRVAKKLVPESTATASDLEHRLRLALANNSAPTAQLEIRVVPASTGGFYLAVIVPPSPAAPHAVLGDYGGRWLRYLVRDGAGMRWMAEAEVATRYSARFQTAAALESRHHRVANEGQRALSTAEGVWLYVAVSPNVSVPATLNRASAEDAEQWLWQNTIASPLDRLLIPPAPIRIAGPGRVTFTGRPYRDDQDEVDPRDSYVELHLSGAAFAATPVSLNTGDGTVGAIGEITLCDDLILLMDLSLTWAARQVGGWGESAVIVGLTDGGKEDLTSPVNLVHSDWGDLRRISGTRRLTRAPRALVAADLAAVGSVQDRLAATYQAAAALLQHFGIPEPDQLTASGSLVARQWGMPRYRQVCAWASSHGVECERLPGDA